MIEGLKPYPEYKETGLFWMGKIPSGWSFARTKTLFRLRIEKSVYGHGHELLSIYTHIGVRPRKDLEQKGNKASTTDGYWIVKRGDIIINKLLAWMGAVGVSHYDGVTSPAYDILRPISELNPDYFHNLLRTNIYLQQFKSRSRGIMEMRLRLYFDQFGQIPLLVPPLKEQAAIVRFLDHANGRIEQAIRAKKKLIALLNEQKQVIIYRAVTRGIDTMVPLKPSGISWIGDIPQHWEVKRLKWVTRLQRGYDLPAERRKSGAFPVVSSGGIIDTHHEARAKAPGVVMGRYGSTEAVFYLEQDFWPHNTSLFVTDFNGNLPRWCFYLLRTISKVDHSSKSAVPGVDRKDLYEIYVPHPPIDEQPNIVTGIEEESSILDIVLQRTKREIELLREYRMRLIADVVTGKLDIREAAANLPEQAAEPEIISSESEPDEDLLEFAELEKNDE